MSIQDRCTHLESNSTQSNHKLDNGDLWSGELNDAGLPHGKGTYQVNVTTHQEMYIQEELFKDDVLVAIEGSCELKLEEENFYLTTILDVKPYLFLRPEKTYLTLDEWRERVNHNDKMEDNHRDAIHVLIDSINQSVEKEYIEKNIIHHMPVWDKVSAMKLK